MAIDVSETTTMPIDVREFLIQFQDYAAPNLDTYEQAIYLYVFRHSRLIDKDEVTIGFKSHRSRLATGVGEGGKPMSEKSAYTKLASLQEKGFITALRTNHKGRLLKLHLPSEIPGLIKPDIAEVEADIELMDFFSVPENRAALLRREQSRCFYTLQQLDKDNFIVEHVVSRPAGDNSYQNCVAASRETNNKKGSGTAEDYLRRLFREGFLNETEFQDRNRALSDLKLGLLKPSFD